MPNHVINEVIFRGVDAAAQDAISAKICSAPGKVDFEVLVPTPPNVWLGNVSSLHEKAFGRERCALDWSTVEWGTKWNAYGLKPIERTEDIADMLKVGQKVVCVDGSPVVCQSGLTMLRVVKGEIYTVRSIQTEPHIPGYGVRLDELLNSLVIWSDGTECEWSYASERFRPVVQVDDGMLEVMSALQ
jgi:hypothetical protein